MEFERLTFSTLESLLGHLNRGYFTSMQMNFPSKDAASRVDISLVVGPFEIIEDGVAFIIDPFWESKIVVKGEFAWASGRFFPEERIEYITVKFADQKPFQLTIFLADDEEDF